MTYNFVFPKIHAKDLTPQAAPKKKKRLSITGKVVGGNPKTKYDHEAMIKDRLAGMAWEDIAKKHNVQHGLSNAGGIARTLVLKSRASNNLTPEQVRLLDGVGYCWTKKP